MALRPEDTASNKTKKKDLAPNRPAGKGEVIKDVFEDESEYLVIVTGRPGSGGDGGSLGGEEGCCNEYEIIDDTVSLRSGNKKRVD